MALQRLDQQSTPLFLLVPKSLALLFVASVFVLTSLFIYFSCEKWRGGYTMIVLEASCAIIAIVWVGNYHAYLWVIL